MNVLSVVYVAVMIFIAIVVSILLFAGWRLSEASNDLQNAQLLIMDM